MSTLCPRCESDGKALEPIAAGEFQAHGCRSCGGVFLDNSVFKVTVVDPAVRAELHQILDQGTTQVDQSAPVACPACRDTMTRQKSGPVAIDVCKKHGIWFDRSELDRVVEQMVAAGVDQQYSPAVEQMRRNLKGQALRAQQQQQAQQQQMAGNGEPVRREKKKESTAEGVFAVVEILGAILEIFAA
jgi:Zn-finger nucleic acid-binding protein